MSDIFIKLFNMSITASWMVLAVIAIRLLLKKAPKWIMGILWSLVAIRLVFPFSVESILSLIPSTETLPQNITVVQKPMIHSGIPFMNSTINPVISDRLSPTAEESVTPMQTLADVVSIIWICGILLMLIYAVISYVRVYSRTREGLEYKERIFLCDRVSSPFIFGIFRPRIYLPSDIDEGDAQYVIAHERAHLKRHDHIWKPVSYLILTVYWFNPVMWIAYILLSRDIELACDERVIREMGEEAKKSYSNALINCSAKQRFITACPVAFGEVGVKGRIKSVLNYKKPAFWIIVVALILCVALTVFFLTDPKEEEAKGVFGENDMRLKVTDIVYDNGIYSYVPTPESAPLYYITKDMILQSEDSFGGIRSYGELKEIELNEEKYDSRFEESWFPDLEEIKKENERAWEVTSDDFNDLEELHIVLEQKDGSVYVGYGYYNSEAEKVSFDEGRYLHMETAKGFGQNPDSSHIRWLYAVETSKGSAVDTSEDNPFFEATVTRVDDEWIRVEVPEDNEYMSKGELFIPNDYTLSGKPMPDLRKNDRIRVIFNGRIYNDDRREVYEIYSVTIEYDAPFSHEVNMLVPTNAEIYMCYDSPEFIAPTLRLSKVDDTFSFTYSLFSSYHCYGRYERDEKELILRTEDGLYTYYFDRDEDTYIFDQDRSSDIPKYNYGEGQKSKTPVPDGAVFISGVNSDLALDSIEADIDKDGKSERCVLTAGPTSGIYSFYFSVYEDGILEYHDLMTPYESSNLSFYKDEKGELYLKGDEFDGEEMLVSIVLENGHIYLYRDGIELGVPSFSYENAKQSFKGSVSTTNRCPTDADSIELIKNHVTAQELAAEETGKDMEDIRYFAYDRDAKMWWISFYPEDNKEENALSVYISADGTEITQVTGE